MFSYFCETTMLYVLWYTWVIEDKKKGAPNWLEKWNYSILNVLRHNCTGYYGCIRKEGESTHIWYGINVGLKKVEKSWKVFSSKGYWDHVFRVWRNYIDNQKDEK